MAQKNELAKAKGKGKTVSTKRHALFFLLTGACVLVVILALGFFSLSNKKKALFTGLNLDFSKAASVNQTGSAPSLNTAFGGVQNMTAAPSCSLTTQLVTGYDVKRLVVGKTYEVQVELFQPFVSSTDKRLRLDICAQNGTIANVVTEGAITVNKIVKVNGVLTTLPHGGTLSVSDFADYGQSSNGNTGFLRLQVTANSVVDVNAKLFVAFPKTGSLTTIPLNFLSVAIINDIADPAQAIRYKYSPGRIGSIYGKGFTTGSTCSANASSLKTELCGVKVLFKNKPAAILFAGPNQINFITPFYAFTDNFDSKIVVVNAKGESDYVGGAINNSSFIASDLTGNPLFPSIQLSNLYKNAASVPESERRDGQIFNLNNTTYQFENFNRSTTPLKTGAIAAIYYNGAGLPEDPQVTDVTTLGGKAIALKNTPQLKIFKFPNQFDETYISSSPSEYTYNLVGKASYAPGLPGIAQLNVKFDDTRMQSGVYRVFLCSKNSQTNLIREVFTYTTCDQGANLYIDSQIIQQNQTNSQNKTIASGLSCTLNSSATIKSSVVSVPRIINVASKLTSKTTVNAQGNIPGGVFTKTAYNVDPNGSVNFEIKINSGKITPPGTYTLRFTGDNGSSCETSVTVTQ